MNSKERKDSQSCSEFIDNLSTNINTNIDSITEHNKCEAANNCVIQNLKKIENNPKPLSDKRINIMKSSPDNSKCEDGSHSVKNKKCSRINKSTIRKYSGQDLNKYSHFDKKIESSKEIILEDYQEIQKMPKRQRNKSCHYHKCQTINNDRRASVISHPISNPTDVKVHSNKKQKKKRTKQNKLKEHHTNKENNDSQQLNENKIKANNSKEDTTVYTNDLKDKEFPCILTDQNDLKNKIRAFQPMKHSAEINDSVSASEDSVKNFEDNCVVNENIPPIQLAN